MSIRIGPDNLSDPITDHLHRDFVTLRTSQRASEALAMLRHADIHDRIVYLYVLDDDDRLAGVVPVRRLLVQEPDATVGSFMLSPVISITADASVLNACEEFMRHRLLALPVVDADGRMLGLVDVNLFTDEVVGFARQRQADQAFQLIGVHVSLGRRVSVWRSFRDRFPWLVCNILSGLACAAIASRYELLISELAMLALFLTVVLALGESVSVQSMTITLQTLAGRRAGLRQAWRSTRKELYAAALLGGACGLAVGLVAWAWRGQGLPAFVVGLAILLSIITACLLGVLIPTAIRALRVDPKVAAGPIVLASADIATLLFYFGLAQRLLGSGH